jgi:hypothetical protein
MSNTKPPSRAKVVWGFGRMVRWVEWYISSSRYISSSDKDRLIKQVKRIVSELMDAHRREQGQIPFPPSVQKKLFPNMKTTEDG